MEEIWKDIEGYKGVYQVSTLGRIRSLDKKVKCKGGFAIKHGKVLKPNKNKKGYYYIMLSDKNIKKVYRMHILIAQTFLPNPENKTTINHKNGIKTDNKIENLEWASQKDNLMHAWKNELNKKGEPKEIFQYDLNGRLINKYESAKEASRQTKIDHANICKCASGKKYCHTAGGYIWKWGKSISELEKEKKSQ